MSGVLASLEGSGAVSGSVSLSDGASVSPGNPVGPLSIYGAVTFQPGGVSGACKITLSASGASQIRLENGASLALADGSTRLELQTLEPLGFGQTFRVIDSAGSGSFTGRFANVPVTGSILTVHHAGTPYHLQISYDANGKSADLTVLTPYQFWIASQGLTGADALFGADPDQDGIPNGLEFVLGGIASPTLPDFVSTNLLPTSELDGDFLKITHRQRADASYLLPVVEFDADLVPAWTTAQHGVDGVTITVTENGFAPGIHRVETRIPTSHGTSGRLFGRIKVTEP